MSQVDAGQRAEAGIAIPPAAASPRLEQFSYDDGIVRLFTLATLVWSIVAMLVGLIIALQLAFPVIPGTSIPTNFGLGELTFSRLRPLHTNAAIFAFAGNAIFAAIYYSTQRLCKARMFSDVLSRLHFWGWQLIIVSAALTLPLGITQSREYAELEWPIDILIAVVWVGFFGVNFFGTLRRRRERHLYVALWFYIATIVTVAVLHVFNNLVVPMGLFKGYSIYAGVQDAFMQWWYGHNAVAFFLTTPFLGLMYYFVPKAANRPVFSYRLSIIHFWSLVFIYIWAGPHHLHYTALPAWASTLGMLFSLMLWMPSWGGGINGLLTLRGAWHKVTTDPVLKFFVVGITFYMMSTFEGPMLSIKSVNALAHYTDWIIGHVHGGALGWNGFMAFGMMYWLLPRLFQTELFSKKLAEWHFWLGTIGILLYIIAMYVAGLTQGLMWRAIDESGNLAYPDFVETTMAIIPFYWIRAIGGAMYLSGVLLGAFNYFMTWKSRPKTYDVPVHTAPALSANYVDPAPPKHRLSDHGHLEVAKKLDVWMQGHWHRRWERLPFRLTIWITVAVVVASLFEIIPTFAIRSNVPTIATVTPYTPLELTGRDIYVREGCYNCHSQMIRPIVAETLRYGEYSKPGEFVYDHPFQWGSRRIGPDLARVGVTRPQASWHFRHFLYPRDVVKDTVMPPFPWLVDRKLDLDKIPRRVQAAIYLGAEYDESQTGEGAIASALAQGRAIAESIEADGDAKADDLANDKDIREVIALIAYLQRLGTDIYKTPEPAEAENDSPDDSTLGAR
jgi:cytochrome c oxidase cbb3-type subunit I/II